MDITKLAMMGDGAYMDVTFDDRDTDIKLKIVGSNSDEYTQYERKIQNKFLKGSGNKKLSAKDLEEANLTKWVACVVDWENMEEDGKPLDCTEANKKRIFSDRKKYKWLTDQI